MRVPKPIDHSIIFVHGLRGHPRHTWATEPSPQKEDVGKAKSASRFLNWRSHKKSESSARVETEPVESAPVNIYRPQDLLPQTIKNARISTYGYDADVVGSLFKGASKNNITQHGQDLMLKLEREVEEEPIIFVAHSLGGILVKEGLHWSKSHINPRYRQLHHHTRHVVFLGVPHRGSQMANDMGETLTRLAAACMRDTNKHIVSSLQVENELLDRINTEFGKMVALGDFNVYSFQEGSGLTGLKGFSGKVVSDFSSKLDNPLEIVETIRGNHMEMARFSNANEEGYRTVSRVIARCIVDSQQDRKHQGPPAGGVINCESWNLPIVTLCGAGTFGRILMRSQMQGYLL